MVLLKDKLHGHRLLLASRSPRRRELLAGAGLAFELADSYDVEETYPPGLPAEEVPGYLAVLKSEAYPHALGVGDILITADTVVICGGRIFGKPDGREGAAAMLAELSGRRHTVVTGVALRAPGRMRSFSVSSDVWFRPLAEEEIAYYVDTFRPYDKAGSYGIQEWIGYVAIERIGGCRCRRSMPNWGVSSIRCERHVFSRLPAGCGKLRTDTECGFIHRIIAITL